MEKMRDKDEGRPAEIRYLPRRNTVSDAEFLKQEVELPIAAHFTEQNELLRKQNKESMDSVQRLSAGVEKLMSV
jgi:hypothetical protein